MNEIKEYTANLFEDIKHLDDGGNEYWVARELQNILGYHHMGITIIWARQLI